MIIDAAQRAGFSLDEIKDLLGSRDGPAHECLRRLAQHKLPEIDELISRATTVQALLRYCRDCQCRSIDECKLLEEPTTLLDYRALRPRPENAPSLEADMSPTRTPSKNSADNTRRL